MTFTVQGIDAPIKL